jgi:hypothetical protein
MQNFDEILDKSNRGRVVRWPFRVLAALIVLGAAFAAWAAASAALRRGDLRAALYTVSFLPIVALVGRLGGYVVWKGHVLRNPYWPFASGSVASVWVLLALIILSYA